MSDNMGIVVSRAAEFTQIAAAFAESGLFPDIKSKAQAFVKIMAGAEMGMPPFTAMNSFHIIQGKAAMSAQAIAARIKASGRYDYQIIEKSAERCELKFYERGKHVHTEVWDKARATKMGVKNMDKMPEAMLFARCVTAGGRAVAPDVIGQFYTAEELGAQIDDAGEFVVEGTATPVDTKPPAPMPKYEPAGPDIGDGPDVTIPPPVARKPPAPMPVAAAIPPVEPTPAATLDNTIDGLVERAQKAIDAMQEHGKQPGPKQVEALREAWSTVWSNAAEKGLKVEPLAGAATPLAYAEGIVRVGKLVIEAEVQS